jgi:ubiquinone/menaquinone biosynthesis C-methylase UbiE
MGHTFDPANIAKLEDPARLQWQAPDVVVGLLQLTGDETVVDYGAGTGVYTLELARALPRGRAVAVDLSEELLARLRDKLVAEPDLAGRVDLAHTTDDSVPLSDGSADAVLAVNLWHEVHDEPAAVAEIVRLLKPGGTLLIVDWAPMERPVGPPNHHLVDRDGAAGEVADLGLTAVALHDHGELFPYHYVIAARRD